MRLYFYKLFVSYLVKNVKRLQSCFTWIHLLPQQTPFFCIPGLFILFCLPQRNVCKITFGCQLCSKKKMSLTHISQCLLQKNHYEGVSQCLSYSSCTGYNEGICVWTDLQEKRQVFTCLQLCSRPGCTAREVTGPSSLGLTEDLHFPVLLSREPNGDDGVGDKHSWPQTFRTDGRFVGPRRSVTFEHVWTCSAEGNFKVYS